MADAERTVPAWEVRFWSHVDRSGGPDACWEWTGGKNWAGYGHFRLGPGSAVVRAHRLSYALAFGPIPEGLYIRHDPAICVTRRCVNPRHLMCGDQLENMADRKWWFEHASPKELPL